MVNANNRSIERSRSQVYSMTAAADILNLQPQDIRKVEVWANVVYVKIAHRLSKFVSMKDFKKSFVERRKKAAEGLQVIPAPMVEASLSKTLAACIPKGIATLNTRLFQIKMASTATVPTTSNKSNPTSKTSAPNTPVVNTSTPP